MQNNRISISLTTIIIIAVIIGSLILGIISYAVYNNFRKDTELDLGNNKKEQSAVNKPQFIEENNKYTNPNSEIINDNNSNLNSNVNSIDNQETSNNVSVDNSITGNVSSKQNPLNIGEWGIASKYVSGGYIDVPAKVTKVTRGLTAAQEVQQYLTSGSSIYKYEDAKDGMEWAVIEYSIDLAKVDKDSTAKLDTKITGTGDNTSIKYNDSIYITSTINMTPNNYTKGNIEFCKFATQLPIGCTDYLIALGNSSSTQAFFGGK